MALTSGTKPQGWFALGAFCICFYALSLLVPPGPVPPVAPAPEATLLLRLFPGVPGWWVLARLSALLAGTCLLACRLPLPQRVADADELAKVPVPPTAVWGALIVAGLHAVSSQFAAGLSRWGQALYLGLLLAPAAIVWLASNWRPLGARQWPAIAGGTLIGSALLIAWCAWRLFVVWDNPRSLNIVDAWGNYISLTEGIERGTNLVTSMTQQGFGDIAILLTGADLFHPGQPPTVRALQVVGMIWIALAAGVVAWSAAHLVSRRAAPLAAAAVLCAPITMMLPYCAYPYSVMLPLPAILLALLVQMHRRRSVAALLLLGPVAGLTATQGYVALCAGPALLAALWIATRRPRFPTAAFATSALSCLAVMLPFWAAFDFARFQHEVSGETWPWSTLEWIVHEQRDPFEPPTLAGLERAGRPGPLDIALGGLLSPFAVPRTALRLWADTLLEPWTAALTAIGLVLCLRSVRHDRAYLAAVLAWLFPLSSVVLASDYDRASPLRNLALPVISAPFVALAFEALYASALPAVRRWGVTASVALCAVSGALIFDWINPRLLSSSATEIILEANRIDRGQEKGALLYLSDVECCSNVPSYVLWSFPDAPLSLVNYRNRRSLTESNGDRVDPVADPIFWSPAMEQQCRIARGICAQWPNAVIYTLHSRSRISRAVAASIDPGIEWRPTLPDGRWTAEPCASFSEPFPGEPRRVYCDPD
ncbi:MAG TPA: glycosyltransferase family 39 protein [Terriglobales bacterium]|nr:glycosyltransferase family 39 protein [Terriglobales bacterium]